MSTQDNALITVVVDGVSLGAFDTLSGGETSATINKRRSGDRPDVEETWPSRGTTVSDVTVTRQYRRERDQDLAKRLRGRVGKALGSATDQPRDEDDVPFGRPTVYSGRLQSVSTGDSDINSSEPRMLSLTFSVGTSA